jgi:hypothetical protein
MTTDTETLEGFFDSRARWLRVEAVDSPAAPGIRRGRTHRHPNRSSNARAPYSYGSQKFLRAEPNMTGATAAPRSRWVCGLTRDERPCSRPCA